MAAREPLVYKDPPGRHTIALVDTRSWIEVWDAEGGGDRTELHRPVVVTSVGHVDKPEIVEGAPWQVAVRRLLYGTTANIEDVIARLEARWRP